MSGQKVMILALVLSMLTTEIKAEFLKIQPCGIRPSSKLMVKISDYSPWHAMELLPKSCNLMFLYYNLGIVLRSLVLWL